MSVDIDHAKITHLVTISLTDDGFFVSEPDSMGGSVRYGPIADHITAARLQTELATIWLYTVGTCMTQILDERSGSAS
jgi:hypothetical protein